MKSWKTSRQEVVFIPSSKCHRHHKLMLKVGRHWVWHARFTHVRFEGDDMLLQDGEKTVAWLELIPDMDRVSGGTICRRCMLVKDGNLWQPPEDVGNSLWDAVTALGHLVQVSEADVCPGGQHAPGGVRWFWPGPDGGQADPARTAALAERRMHVPAP